jgi:hypothetical protein
MEAKMAKTIEAVFDGTALVPDEPLDIKANTRVRLTIEAMPGKTGEPYSFFEVAKAQKLQGPEDWSVNLDHYLYGHEKKEP